MKNNKSIFLLLTLFLLLSIQNSFGQKNKANFVRVSQNTYAPNLYSDKLNLQILLVNLLGVQVKGSSFESYYEIYFVPEGEIERIAENQGGRLEELKSTDIQNKILLNRGSFTKSSLSLSRIFEKNDITFKEKIPDKQRTMLGKILVFYSLKVYDAALKKNIYKDSSFIYLPFESDNINEARKTVHLSFFINPDGKLYTSSLSRDKSSTTW